MGVSHKKILKCLDRERTKYVGIIQHCQDISNFPAARKTDANKQPKIRQAQATDICELEGVEWNKNILD